MKKIPTLFERDPKDMRLVTRTVAPGCEWVLQGEGVPTRKRDGTNVAVEVAADALGGRNIVVAAWKRRNVTREERANGLEPGYVAVESCDPGDKWLRAAFEAEFPGLYGNPPSTVRTDWPVGLHSCEALGEKIQGGVEGTAYRLYPFDLRPETLWPENTGHGLLEKPWTYDSLQRFFEETPRLIEGIVWHHPDGRRAKIKSRDFGIRWPR